MKQGSIVIDSGDAAGLSGFYARLLKWKQSGQIFEDDRWFIVADPAGKGLPLVFQQDDAYEPPVWPAEPGKQKTMMHLDFYVEQDGLEAAASHALACGAKPADVQFSKSWRVFLDPAGHPFCIIPIPLTTASET